ncbi:interferon-induced protein 44-like [Takifugu flavidus]|uniref:interferon-induced protein 44-like n=1 Tax=Takifugu flavidus TaxID=433684 RepID=UPI0025445129|nr:interferon-induced protein 44-like [Takifugu flavidus]
MSTITSSLSQDQEKKLLSLFGHARLHLLYKASVQGFTADAFHSRCDHQGPTVIVAFNTAGRVYGAYTSKDYTKSGQPVIDGEAFLYSIKAEEPKPLKVVGIAGQPAFTDVDTSPDFGALVFLHDNKPSVLSNPGTNFNFQAPDMHGGDFALIELEVYRVESLGILLKKPWRNIQWTTEKKQELLQNISKYRPGISAVPQARILLVGPVGAGKSSFFNSISSIFRGSMTCQAIAGTADKSVTTQYRTYRIMAGKRGQSLPLVLCDTMGLEEMTGAGVDIEDLFNIFRGHIVDRYQFSPSGPLMPDSPGYKTLATLNDKIHCIAYVVDTCKASILSQKMLDKFDMIRKKASQMGIPQILLMTKVDEACSLVADDLRTIYHSVYIQKKARDLSQCLGIPLSCVIPVKNYSEELEPDQDTDILLLTALMQMLHYSDSFLENQLIYEEQEGHSLQQSDKSCEILRPGL